MIHSHATGGKKKGLKRVSSFRGPAYTNTDGTTTRITCAYDYMGRRTTKKVEIISVPDTETGESTSNTILHQRYIYRGYLQIAGFDLTESGHAFRWFITWDPTQPVSTRPLAIRKEGTWYCYGWDLTKNVCEIFSNEGYINNTVLYSYTPYGAVSAEGSVFQPIQWSSEFMDEETHLTMFLSRFYNNFEGRWLSRDILSEEGGINLYAYAENSPINQYDIHGMSTLRTLIKYFIENGNISPSLDGCTEGSLQLLSGGIPFIFLGVPSRLMLSAELSTMCCCDKASHSRKRYFGAEVTVEAFAQLGVMHRRHHHKLSRERRRPVKKQRIDRVEPGVVPPVGVGEKGGSASASWGNNMEECPTSRFTFYNPNLYAFVRGSAGAYWGVYGNVQFNPGLDFEFSLDYFLSRLSAEGGVATDIYGVSVEAGFGGNVSVANIVI